MGTITHKFKGVEDVFLVEWYLELLKATHTAVAEMGEPMAHMEKPAGWNTVPGFDASGTTIFREGLMKEPVVQPRTVGKADPSQWAEGFEEGTTLSGLDKHNFNHPVESNEFRVKANQVLNFLGITYDGVLQMLETLGASEEEIMYAWDLNNQFYNDGDPWNYRPENIWTDRQGDLIGPNTQEVIAAGGSPRYPGVKLGPSAGAEERQQSYLFNEEARRKAMEHPRYTPMENMDDNRVLSPYQQDVTGVPMPHEGIFQRQGLSALMANSATEWAIELGIGALVGPIGQHAFGKAFQKLSNGFRRGNDLGLEEGVKLADVYSLSNRINFQAHPSGVVNLDTSTTAFGNWRRQFVKDHGREPTLNEGIGWAQRTTEPPQTGELTEWANRRSPEPDEDLLPTMKDPDPKDPEPSRADYDSEDEYFKDWYPWTQRNEVRLERFSEDYRLPGHREGADPDRVKQWEWEDIKADQYFDNFELTRDGHVVSVGHILATPETGPGSIKFEPMDRDAFEVVVDNIDKDYFGYASQGARGGREGDILTGLSKEFQEKATVADMIRYRDSDTMVLNPRQHVKTMESRVGFDPTESRWSATGEILSDPKLKSNAWGEIEALGYDAELFIHNLKNSILTARRSSDPERFFDVLNEARVSLGLPPHTKLTSPSGTSYLDQPLEDWEKMFLATYEHELAHLRIKQTGGVVQKERQAQQYMLQQLQLQPDGTGITAPPGGYDELAWSEFQPKIKAQKLEDSSQGIPDPVVTMAGGVQPKVGDLPNLPDIHFLNEGSSFTNKSKAYREYVKYIEMMENKNTIKDRLVGTLFYPLAGLGVTAGTSGLGYAFSDDFRRHIDTLSDIAGKVVDNLVGTLTGIGNPVIDYLSPGFANQVFGMNQALRGANLLAAANDAGALDGIQGSLRRGGHNPQDIMPMDVIQDIKNGDAVIVGYETDADVDKAIDMGRKMGVYVDADLPHIWRKPKAKFALPPKGEPATVDHFKKLAMSQIYYPESRKP